MCCSSVIAVLSAFKALDKVTKYDVVNCAIRAENVVGVSCGGMDQAASVFSSKAGLLSVEFHPTLDVQSLNLPTTPPAVLVIANSLVHSDKHVTSKFRYNLRFVETRVAAAILAKRLGIKLNSGTLKELVDRRFGNATGRVDPSKALEQLDTILAEMETAFGSSKDGFAWTQVHGMLGTSESDFKERFHPAFDIEAQQLQLYKRTKHVVRALLTVIQTLTKDKRIARRVQASLSILRTAVRIGRQSRAHS